MQFQSKIFVPVKNRGAWLADFGGFMFFTSLVLIAVLKAMKVRSLYSIHVVWLWAASIVLIFVGRRLAKGNMFTIGLSDTDLIVKEDSIQVGNALYPMDQIKDLEFWIEGYDGMIGIRFKGYRSFSNRGRLSGADNKIHFRAGGKKYLYQFYLRDEVWMEQLGRIFRIYYAQGVPFRECNRGGPTFLFRQVRSKKEMEDMKRREGYAG